MIILISWVVFLRATMSSLGKIGLALTVGFFAILFWLIIDLLQKWLPLQGATFFQYVLLLIVSLVLATGMSWSHIRKRLSGQIDVDDVET
jgi:H+/Cl- antiporter ClcA